MSGLRRGKILDLNVWLVDLRHTWPDDVDVLLVGPQGQNVIIMSDVGFDIDASNVELKLDDEAAGFLPDSTQLVEGTFRPSNWNDVNDTVDTFPGAPAPSEAFVLSTFDRTNPNGTWSLYVYDDSGGDVGRILNGWSLEIKARVLR